MRMESCYTRTEFLIGSQSMEKLKHAKVLLFGLGGVGSYTAEAIARSGIGDITIVDNDTISITNINRQIPALTSTVGMLKTQVMGARIHKINPSAVVSEQSVFVSPDTISIFDFSKYDYVIDAVDNVTAKLLIIEGCYEARTPVISCMGTGNKLDPTQFKIADIYDTSVCPLARVMRRELRRRGVESCKVLYSEEEPIKPKTDELGVPGSISFVPSVAGLIIAGTVIKDIIGV